MPAVKTSKMPSCTPQLSPVFNAPTRLLLLVFARLYMLSLIQTRIRYVFLSSLLNEKSPCSKASKRELMSGFSVRSAVPTRSSVPYTICDGETGHGYVLQLVSHG